MRRQGGRAEGDSVRVIQDSRDHAHRHSNLSPAEYLDRGRQNVTDGVQLKGGKYPDAGYYVRKVGEDSYSLTITDKKGQILSIDTWSKEGATINQEKLSVGFRNSGITPPKHFWESL